MDKQNRNRLSDTVNKLVVAIGEGDYEVQTSNYKINKSWGCNVHIGNIVNNIVTTLHGDRW